MSSYVGSTEKFEVGETRVGDGVSKKKCQIVTGLCLIFAILLLVFIILYAKESAKKAEPVKTPGGTGKIYVFYFSQFRIENVEIFPLK